MPILKKQFLPSILTAYPQFKGASINECVEGWSGRNDEHAHSHVYPKDPFVGWICFRSLAQLSDPQMQRHELAHIINTFEHGHDKTWRHTLLELGGHLEAYNYQIGTMKYNVPCHTASCFVHEGRDPEETFPYWAMPQEDVKFAELLRRHPTMLEERDRLVKFLDRYPIDKKIHNGEEYLRQKLETVKNSLEYCELMGKVAVPIDVMF